MERSDKYDEQRPRFPPFYSTRRRYRGRIVYCEPESWIVFSFFFLLAGTTLIIIHRFLGLPTRDSNTLLYIGAILLCFGWLTLVWIYGTTRVGIIRELRSDLFTDPPRVGVYLPPPIDREWLSAMLLPRINRGWVAGETLPGYEPYQLAIAQPPVRPAPSRHPQLPSSIRNRNLENKNSRVLDNPTGESSTASNAPSIQTDESSKAFVDLSKREDCKSASNQQVAIRPEDSAVAFTEPECEPPVKQKKPYVSKSKKFKMRRKMAKLRKMSASCHEDSDVASGGAEDTITASGEHAETIASSGQAEGSNEASGEAAETIAASGEADVSNEASGEAAETIAASGEADVSNEASGEAAETIAASGEADVSNEASGEAAETIAASGEADVSNEASGEAAETIAASGGD